MFKKKTILFQKKAFSLCAFINTNLFPRFHDSRHAQTVLQSLRRRNRHKQLTYLIGIRFYGNARATTTTAPINNSCHLFLLAIKILKPRLSGPQQAREQGTFPPPPLPRGWVCRREEKDRLTLWLEFGYKNMMSRSMGFGGELDFRFR